MSGEAYELPETRAERLEPTLASIQEQVGGGSTGSARSNEDLFTISIPAPPVTFPGEAGVSFPGLPGGVLPGGLQGGQAEIEMTSSSSSSLDNTRDNIMENMTVGGPPDTGTTHKGKRKKQVRGWWGLSGKLFTLGGFSQFGDLMSTTNC